LKTEVKVKSKVEIGISRVWGEVCVWCRVIPDAATSPSVGASSGADPQGGSEGCWNSDPGTPTPSSTSRVVGRLHGQRLIGHAEVPHAHCFRKRLHTLR